MKENTVIKLFAEQIVNRMSQASVGHCSRVDYLSPQQAHDLCHSLNTRDDASFMTRLLTTAHEHDLFALRVDEAIEVRNKKEQKLCLLVPTDLTDAAYSSLANAFAVIDSRQIFKSILDRERRRLPQAARNAVTFSGKGTSNTSVEAKIDYTLAVLGDEHPGLALWRLGLIPDGREMFDDDVLKKNRACVQQLAAPARLTASLRDRLQAIHVDEATMLALLKFFGQRSMSDARAWSQALVHTAITFDHWNFIEDDHSDIQSVTLTPFLNDKGLVEKQCKLHQPDGDPFTSLRAYCGPKQTLVVSWKCEPLKPENIANWNLRILPEGWEPNQEIDEEYHELPIPPVVGNKRKQTIKLEFDEQEVPDGAVCVYVIPLTSSGQMVKNAENTIIFAASQTFYFADGAMSEPPLQEEKSIAKENRVPTLDVGRLILACDPKWQANIQETKTIERGGLRLFSVIYPHQKKMTLAMSHVLTQLEAQLLEARDDLGIYRLDVQDIVPIDGTAFQRCQAIAPDAVWGEFLKKRRDFFNALSKQKDRVGVACADWGEKSVVRSASEYMETYTQLLQVLQNGEHDPAQLHLALSVDSVLVSIPNQRNAYEEAIIILPTHPVRVAWYLGYTQLMQKWQQSLESLSNQERKKAFDKRWVELLAPNNVPFLTWHLASRQSFVFFKNLLFFSGIAIPTTVADPNRLFGDIMTLLGIASGEQIASDSLTNRLATHFQRFNTLHPYVTTECLTLINPDRGNEVAEALTKTITSPNTEDVATKYAITAYVADEHMQSMPAFDPVQELLAEKQEQHSPYFAPSLALSIRQLSALQRTTIPDSHLAIVMDYTDCDMSIVSADTFPPTSGVALNALMVRIDPVFTCDEDGLIWRYALNIDESKRYESIQSATKYTADLATLYHHHMEAGGYHLSGKRALPVLSVRLMREHMTRLEQLHQAAHWVITMDRFITLDYYDSPLLPSLSSLAKKYVVDYTPDMVENIGHRLMVTTAWHAELESILANAVAQLGIAQLDTSVGYFLHAIKMVSGRLALSVLDSTNSAAGIVGLGIVALWLQKNNVLKNSVLVPVDSNQQLFSNDDAGAAQRRCDLMLVSLEKSGLSFTFIEVKWRRTTTSFQSLCQDMATQIVATMRDFERIYQDESRIDAPLRRAHLSNVIRFSVQRARRYGLISQEIEDGFYEQLAAMEKKITNARILPKGFIVTPEQVTDDTLREVSLQGQKIKIQTISAMFLMDESRDERGIDPHPREEHREVLSASLPLPQSPLPPEAVRKELSTAPLSLDEAVGSEGTVLLGEAHGDPITWTPRVTGNPHLFIIGIPGQGKSYTMTRILTELHRLNVPALTLDFHGQFADPDDAYFRSVHPHVLDAATGLPFSPFECTQADAREEWETKSYELAEIVAHIASLGDMQLDLVHRAIRAAYQQHGSLDDVFDPDDIPTLSDVFAQIERLEQKGTVKNVSSRCRVLFEMKTFRPTHPPINLISTIQAGLVVDLHAVRLEQMQISIGSFLLHKIYRDMFHWGPSRRVRLAIVLDEAHRLAKDVTLPRLMKEGRKFGIAVLVASQSASDFHQDILPNAGTKICFRVNYPESRKIAAYLGGRNQEQMIERIQKLGVGQAFVQTPDVEIAKLTQMLPPA